MTDRPQYDPAFVATARALASRGAMDYDIAVALGIKPNFRRMAGDPSRLRQGLHRARHQPALDREGLKQCFQRATELIFGLAGRAGFASFALADAPNSPTAFLIRSACVIHPLR